MILESTNYKRWVAVSGALAGGLAASACCVLPMILLWVGISGAWIANLTALAEYHGIFIGAAMSLLALSYYFIFIRRKRECDEGELCSRPLPDTWVKASFWLAAIMISIAAVFPYAVNFYYGG